LEEIGANDPEVRAYAQMLLDALEKGLIDESKGRGLDASAFTLRVLGVSEEFGPIAAGIIEEQRRDLLRQVAAGETGVRALTEFLNLGAFELVVSTIATAMGDLGDSTQEYESIAKTLMGATEQEREIFNQLAGEISGIVNDYEELSKSTEDYGVRVLFVAKAQELANKQAQLAELLGVAAAGQRAREFRAPSILGVEAGATPEQIRKAVADTRRLQEEQVQAMSPDAAEQRKLRSEWENVILQLGETIDSTYSQVFTDLDPGIFADVLREAGLEAQGALGIITPDIPSAQAPQLRGNIAFFERIIKQLRPLDRQDQGVIFSDYITDILHADNLAVQLALQTLIDVNEQQLEGIFNIPEGVTAQIPFTGRLFFSDQPIPTAGVGGILEALAPPLEQLPGEIATAADTAHTDALTTIEVLNLMLAAGQGSAEFLEKVEGIITEMGGEPVERGEMGEPVGWESSSYAKMIDKYMANMRADLSRSLADVFRVNPELTGPYGMGQMTAEDVLSVLPQSIPVTINTRVNVPITVVVDGMKVQQALEERHYEDLESATRRTGATGYMME